MINCKFCGQVMKKRNVVSHLEQYHFGEDQTTLFRYYIRCGSCICCVPQEEASSMVDHCLKTGHEASQITLDWSEFINNRTDRVRNLVSAGVDLCREGKKHRIHSVQIQAPGSNQLRIPPPNFQPPSFVRPDSKPINGSLSVSNIFSPSSLENPPAAGLLIEPGKTLPKKTKQKKSRKGMENLKPAKPVKPSGASPAAFHKVSQKRSTTQREETAPKRRRRGTPLPRITLNNEDLSSLKTEDLQSSILSGSHHGRKVEDDDTEILRPSVPEENFDCGSDDSRETVDQSSPDTGENRETPVKDASSRRPTIDEFASIRREQEEFKRELENFESHLSPIKPPETNPDNTTSGRPRGHPEESEDEVQAYMKDHSADEKTATTEPVELSFVARDGVEPSETKPEEPSADKTDQILDEISAALSTPVGQYQDTSLNASRLTPKDEKLLEYIRAKKTGYLKKRKEYKGPDLECQLCDYVANGHGINGSARVALDHAISHAKINFYQCTDCGVERMHRQGMLYHVRKSNDCDAFFYIGTQEKMDAFERIRKKAFPLVDWTKHGESLLRHRGIGVQD